MELAPLSFTEYTDASPRAAKNRTGELHRSPALLRSQEPQHHAAKRQSSCLHAPHGTEQERQGVWSHPAPRAGATRLPGETGFDREALYAQLAPLVRRLIHQYGHTPEMRQDLAGEIYCRFCALVEAYDPQRGVPLRPYLIRQLGAATYTYARQQWRTGKREQLLELSDATGPSLSSEDPTSGWIQRLSEQQVRASLPEALKQLPLRQQQVVIWRYYEERSFEDIAELMAVQPATVRSLLRHGLNKLRQLLVPGHDAE